jgi:methylglyoxal reductase
LRDYLPAHADSLAQLAIKYVLHHPGVTCVNISLQQPEHADENLRVLEQAPLPDSVFDDIRKHHRWLHNLYEAKYFGQDDSKSIGGFKKPVGK